MLDIEQAYAQYGPMVLRRCRRLLRDEHDAADAMQEVFVRLVAARERLDDQALSSLLYRIATQVSLNRLRTARRRPEDPDDALLLSIATRTSDAEARSIARNLLDRIFGREPASTGAIAVMHLLDGMTLQEVADEVGLSVSGVRKRLRTLRGRIDTLEP